MKNINEIVNGLIQEYDIDEEGQYNLRTFADTMNPDLDNNNTEHILRSVVEIFIVEF